MENLISTSYRQSSEEANRGGALMFKDPGVTGPESLCCVLLHGYSRAAPKVKAPYFPSGRKHIRKYSKHGRVPSVSQKCKVTQLAFLSPLE